VILLAIKIKRFGVRYKGIRYGPGLPGGSILYGLSEEEEDRLIAASNGTIEKYTEDKIAKEENGTNNPFEAQNTEPIKLNPKAKKKKAMN